MGRYTFEISSDPIWWTINSVDKPENITLSFTPITIQNVNWIDSFNISFIADKNTYTYLKITDTATNDRPYYYYLETTSKKLTQGFECRGKLDVWATFLTGLGTDTKFSNTYDYPVYVDRFLNTNKTCLETYYNSVSYLQKDEFFDYSHFPLTTNPNNWVFDETHYNLRRNTNLFGDTMFNNIQLNIYNYGIFQTSAWGSNSNRTFTSWKFIGTGGSDIGVNNGVAYNNFKKYYNGVPYFIAEPFDYGTTHTMVSTKPDLLGILFQPSTDDSVYRLVITANQKDQYLLLNCNAHYNGSTSNNPTYGGKLINARTITSGYACILLDKFTDIFWAIMGDAKEYAFGGATDANSGYWRDKIIGVFKMDFLELLSLDGFTFTTYNASVNYGDTTITNITKDLNGKLVGSRPTNSGVLFKDFRTKEWLKVVNQIKWRWSTYKGHNATTNKNEYWVWKGPYKDEYNNIDNDFTPPTTTNNIQETYKRIDSNNYLLRYPMSRISIDNYCMNPFFGVWIRDVTTSGDPINQLGYGWLDSPLSAVAFDGNNWVLVSPYKNSFLFTTEFTQRSYTIATDGYKSYLNSVKSQQDATLRVAQANAIYGGVMGGVGGTGGFLANLFTGNIPAVVGSVMNGLDNAISGGLQYYAQEQQIEAQRQDMRRSATAHVIQAGNTQAIALNIGRTLIDSDNDYSANSTGWMVRAPLTSSDIQYYNSLVWKMGIKAGFNIALGYVVGTGTDIAQYRQRQYNPFHYFQIKDFPEPLIRKWYPNLQDDYIQAIKAIFAGGVRMWNRNLSGNNNTDAFTMRWDLEDS